MRAYPFRNRAFTLIEALFSVGIAGVVLTLLFGYFTQSVKSVAHNEDTLETIREINKLTTQLRRDLYQVAPYSSAGGAPIDLRYAPTQFNLKDRYYRTAVRTIHQGGIDDVATNETVVRFRLLETKDGVKIYERKATMDPFFDRPVQFNETLPIADGIVGVTREVKPPEGFGEFGQEFRTSLVKVAEVYLHIPQADNRLIFYRFYPPPYSFVRRYTRNIKGEEILLDEFAKRRGTGRLQAFSISPVFQYVKYNPKPLEGAVIEYNRFWSEVDLVFSGETKGTGPDSRKIPVQFKVENSYLNSNKWKEGMFQ